MIDHVFTGRTLGRALMAPLAACAFLSTLDAARADTPEYWAKETFKLEKPTMFVASLDTDEGASERRSQRRAAPRASVGSQDEEKPAPRRQRRQASDESQSKPKPKPVRVASLGTAPVAPPKPERSLSGGGGIKWVASAGCLNGTLRGVLSQVASRFGSVTVNSTCRSKSRNAAVGGASRSMHLTGDAADFRINGNWGAASGFIRSLVGGFKHYGGGLFHIDTGSKRTW